MKVITVATRGSPLARLQTDLVIRSLVSVHPYLKIQRKIALTKGDIIQDTALSRIGVRGLFTRELDKAVLSR